MNIDLFTDFAPYLIGIVGLCWSFVLTRAKAAFATKEDLDRIVTSLQNVKYQIQSYEEKMSSVPKEKSLHELAMVIEKLNGTVKEMGAELKAIGKQQDVMSKNLTRQENYLLNKK